MEYFGYGDDYDYDYDYNEGGYGTYARSMVSRASQYVPWEAVNEVRNTGLDEAQCSDEEQVANALSECRRMISFDQIDLTCIDILCVDQIWLIATLVMKDSWLYRIVYRIEF